MSDKADIYMCPGFGRDAHPCDRRSPTGRFALDHGQAVVKARNSDRAVHDTRRTCGVPQRLGEPVRTLHLLQRQEERSRRSWREEPELSQGCRPRLLRSERNALAMPDPPKAGIGDRAGPPQGRTPAETQGGLAKPLRSTSPQPRFSPNSGHQCRWLLLGLSHVGDDVERQSGRGLDTSYRSGCSTSPPTRRSGNVRLAAPSCGPRRSGVCCTPPRRSRGLSPGRTPASRACARTRRQPWLGVVAGGGVPVGHRGRRRRPGRAAGPGRQFEPRLVPKGARRLRRPRRHDHLAVRRRDDGPRHPAPPGPHARHRAVARHDLQDHRRGAGGGQGLAGPPAGGDLPDRLPRRAGGEGPRRRTRSATGPRTSPSASTWTGSSTCSGSGSRPPRAPSSGPGCAPSCATAASATC